MLELSANGKSSKESLRQQTEPFQERGHWSVPGKAVGVGLPQTIGGHSVSPCAPNAGYPRRICSVCPTCQSCVGPIPPFSSPIPLFWNGNICSVSLCCWKYVTWLSVFIRAPG
jgi:hypothetical protein